jgi:hypothetical protein
LHCSCRTPVFEDPAGSGQAAGCLDDIAQVDPKIVEAMRSYRQQLAQGQPL